MEFNGDFFNLPESYLFAEVADAVSGYEVLHPDKRVLKLSIGDVTLPLPPTVVGAMRSAAAETGDKKTFRGYLPYEGCGFLRESIKNYYKSMGADVSADEIFISDGAKSDLWNLPDLFKRGLTALVPDPVYPVYAESNVLKGNRVVYAAATEQNGFLPMPDYGVKAGLIYICSPNNPTGAAYTPEQLQEWVEYAIKTGAVILYDAAYESFVRDGKSARTIYSCAGAESCAVEICSLSKTAGFTGLRCGYTVVPKALKLNGVSANKLWYRLKSTCFNGVSYVVQRAAEAAFSAGGLAEIKKNTGYYMQNAKILSGALSRCGVPYWGGKNSPYIWLKCPRGTDSRGFFKELLNGAGIAGTPGAGFGAGGEGYLRLSSFSDAETALEAAERLENFYKTHPISAF